MTQEVPGGVLMMRFCSPVLQQAHTPSKVLWTHAERRLWRVHLFALPEKEPGTTLSLSPHARSGSVCTSSLLSVYVCVAGMRRNSPGCRVWRFVWFTSRLLLSSLLLLLPRVLLHHPPLHHWTDCLCDSDGVKSKHTKRGEKSVR